MGAQAATQDRAAGCASGRLAACAVAPEGRARPGSGSLAPVLQPEGRMSSEGRMSFTDFETARTARGLRVIIAEGIPSPWSQAALGLFQMKGIDHLVVPFRQFRDAVRAHTGSHNAPVVLFDDEPPRTGWADILALAERLGGRLSLVPDDPELAVRLHGLSHAILSEAGLGWNVRLLLTHASMTTEGRQGWPAPVAARLAPKYGYAPDRAPAARARAIATLRLLARTLDESGGEFFLGGGPTALDVYAATMLGVIAPLPPEVCPMLPPLRQAFETLDPEVRAAVAPSLLRHRDRMYERHLRVPLVL
jgi:glutathione S-transferase